MNRKLMTKQKTFSCLTLACLFGSLLGCGEPRPDGMPTLYPASVTVVQDGKPLADASVTLIPTDTSLARWPMGGVTDAQGVAKLKTYMKFDGVPADSFKVTVNKSVTTGDEKPVHPGVGATPQQLSEYDRAMKTGSFQVTKVVAAKFRLPNTTPLSVDVSSAGPNDFSLDVGAAVSEKDAAASSRPGAAAEYQPMGEQ